MVSSNWLSASSIPIARRTPRSYMELWSITFVLKFIQLLRATLAVPGFVDNDSPQGFLTVPSVSTATTLPSKKTRPSKVLCIGRY